MLKNNQMQGQMPMQNEMQQGGPPASPVGQAAADPTVVQPNVINQLLQRQQPSMPPEMMDMEAKPPRGPSSYKGNKILDGPVPGESLTMEPGQHKWERPPQFTRPEEATDYIFNELLKPANTAQVLTFLRKGVPVEALSKTIIFAGFTEGKWSVDVAGIIAEPIMQMIAAMGSRAEIKNMKLTMKDRSGTPIVKKLMKSFISKPTIQLKNQTEDAAALLGGLASPDMGEAVGL